MLLTAYYFARLWVGLNVNMHIEKICLFPRVGLQSSTSLKSELQGWVQSTENK